MPVQKQSSAESGAHQRHGYSGALKIASAAVVLAAIRADRAAENAHKRSLTTEADTVRIVNSNSDHGIFFLFGCGTPARQVTPIIAERLRTQGISANIVGIVYPEANFANAASSVAYQILKAKHDLGIVHQKDVNISLGGAMRTALHQDRAFRRSYGRSAATVLHSPVFDFNDILAKPQRVAGLAEFVEHTHSRSLETFIPKAVRAYINHRHPGEMHVEQPGERPACMEQLVGQMDFLRTARAINPEDQPLQGVADEVFLIQCGINEQGHGDDVANMPQSSWKFKTAVGPTPFIPVVDTKFPGIHAALPESTELVGEVLTGRQLAAAA